MKIRKKETFEQSFQKKPQQSSQFGSVDNLKFAKNQVYNVFVVPKITEIDLSSDEVEVDYPFEEIKSHYGTYDFMKDYMKVRPYSVKCKGCAIDDWMGENRLPKSVFKIAVASIVYLTYVIHDRKIKAAWFPDYLYGAYRAAISKMMTDKDISLLDAFSHKVKIFTNAEGKLDVEVDPTVCIPIDNPNFKLVLQQVYEKPLYRYIEEQVTTDDQSISNILASLQQYSDTIIDSERQANRNAKMEERTQMLSAAMDAFKKPEVEVVKSGNEIITDDLPTVGPLNVPDSDQIDEDVPF